MSKHTDEFLTAIKWYVNYWDKQNGTTKENLSGLAFSILVMLDGHSGSFDGNIESLAKECDVMLHEDFYKEKETVLHAADCDCQECLDKWKLMEKENVKR